MLDTHLTDFMTLVDFSRVILGKPWRACRVVYELHLTNRRLHVRNQKKLVRCRSACCDSLALLQNGGLELRATP